MSRGEVSSTMARTEDADVVTTIDPTPAVDDLDDDRAAPDATPAPAPATESATGRGRRWTSAVAAAVLWFARLPVRTGAWFAALLERRPRTALAGLGAVVVVFGALATGGWWIQHTSNARQADRIAALNAATSEVTALLSYDPSTVGGLVDRVAPGLTPSFRTDYGTLISQVIAPAATSKQISTTATVTGGSVVLDSTAPDQLTVLLFVNQSTRSGPAGAPQLGGSRVRVLMTDVDGRWLVSDLKPI